MGGNYSGMGKGGGRQGVSAVGTAREETRHSVTGEQTDGGMEWHQ